MKAMKRQSKVTAREEQRKQHEMVCSACLIHSCDRLIQILSGGMADDSDSDSDTPMAPVGFDRFNVRAVTVFAGTTLFFSNCSCLKHSERAESKAKTKCGSCGVSWKRRDGRKREKRERRRRKGRGTSGFCKGSPWPKALVGCGCDFI